MSSASKADFDELEITIRSVLTSVQGGCELRVLESGYIENCGHSIPFRKFGFASLPDLLRSLTHVVRIVRVGNVDLFRAVDSQETVHIARLVSGQKSSKKVKRFSGSSRGRGRGGCSSMSYRGRGYGPVARSRPLPPRDSFRRPQASNDLRHTLNDLSHHKMAQGGTSTLPTSGTVPRTSTRPAFGTVPRTQPAPAAPSFNRSTQRFQAPPQQIFQTRRFDDPPRQFQPNFTATTSVNPAKLQLEETAKKCGLPVPIFSVLRQSNKFFCSVQVGDHRIGSQTEFNSQEEALSAAAQNAVQRLTSIFSISNKDELLKTEEDFERLVENMLVLLKEYPCGIISKFMDEKYFNKFGAHLPSDWLKQLAENGPEICIDPIANTTKCIVTQKLAKNPPPPAMPQSSAAFFTNIVPLTSSTKAKTDSALDGVRLPMDSTCERRVNFDERKNKIFEISLSPEDRELRKSAGIFSCVTQALKLPETDYFSVSVTVAFTPGDFYVRISEASYAEAFCNFHAKLQEFYLHNDGDKIESIVDFHANRPLYAAFDEDSWHRVAVIEASEGSRTAVVQFVDHGDSEKVDWALIRQLEPEFVAFPAQAVRARLVNFCTEVWADENFGQEMVTKFQALVVGKNLTANFCTEEDETLGPSCFYDRYLSPRLSLVLYGEDEEMPSDVFCVNEIIEAMVSPEKMQEMAAHFEARSRLVELDVSSLIDNHNVAPLLASDGAIAESYTSSLIGQNGGNYGVIKPTGQSPPGSFFTDDHSIEGLARLNITENCQNGDNKRSSAFFSPNGNLGN